MTASVLNFGTHNKTPMIAQTEVAECGLASLVMISCYYGNRIDLSIIRTQYSANIKGINLKQMIELADTLNLSSRPLQCNVDEVYKLQKPCILHWDMNHFVVLTKVSGKEDKAKFYVNDPAIGRRILNLEDFSKHYTGVSLEVTPTNNFEKKKEGPHMKLSQLWSSMSGLKSGLLKLVGLSFVLQLFALMSPYYMQWVVDEVLVSFDESLLTVLAVGFALIAIISVTTNAVRSWLILRVSSILNMQMGVNLLRHMLRLPMSYFESRHIGDVVSRFSSLEQIRERITTGVVETFVDGIMTITVLIMMLFYSIKLTLVVLATVLLYTLIRLALYAPLHQATEELIQCESTLIS